MRELVILRGASGYIALYRFDPVRNIGRILRNAKQLGTTKPLKPFTTPSNGEDNGIPW